MKTILTIHAIVTFAAGILLVVKPEAIPQTVNIQLTEQSYLLCYFLAAAEIAIAYLSFAARRLTGTTELRLILNTFIIFHLCTAGLELFALSLGINGKIIANVLLRLGISIVFVYLGYFRKTPSQ